MAQVLLRDLLVGQDLLKPTRTLMAKVMPTLKPKVKPLVKKMAEANAKDTYLGRLKGAY